MTGSDSKNQKMPRMRDRIRSDCFGPDHIGIFRKEDRTAHTFANWSGYPYAEEGRQEGMQ